jgi:diacylglycerol kinase (ATP)
LPVGIIPLGRGNDFARNLGIRRDRHSIRSWDEVPEVQVLDLPTVNGSPFASVACLGFDAVVNRLARERAGYFGGTLGYVVCVFKALCAFQPFAVEVIVDGWRWSGDVMMVAVANGPCYGGGMRIAPRASMRDGQVDVCIVKAVSKPTLVRQFPRVFRGSHTSHPAVITLSGRTVSVTTDRDQDLYADGERVGCTPAVVTLADQQLRVLIPPSSTNAKEAE